MLAADTQLSIHIVSHLSIDDCQLRAQAHEKTRAAARKAMPAHYSAPSHQSASRPGSTGAPSPTSSSGAPRTPRTLASYSAFGWQQQQQRDRSSSGSGCGIVDPSTSAAKRHRHQSLLLAPAAAAAAAATVKAGAGVKTVAGSKSSSPVVMQTLAGKRRSTIAGGVGGGAESRGAKTLKPSLKAPTPPGSDEGVFERRVG
jgi:hypothetical protein